MSLFINNNSGPIYNHCAVTIDNRPLSTDRCQVEYPCADRVQTEKPRQEYTLPIPQEGKYTEVRKYIEERKRFDEEFKTYCLHHSLRDLCMRLSKEFGWFVDENSLQKNLNRNR